MTDQDFAALPIEFGSRLFTSHEVAALIAPPVDRSVSIDTSAAQRIGRGLAHRARRGDVIEGAHGPVRLVPAGMAYGGRRRWRFAVIAPPAVPADPNEDLL